MAKNVRRIRQREESDAVISVRAAVDDFLASTEVKRLRPKTREEYTYILSEFAKWCAEHSMQQNRSDKTWKAIKADSKHLSIDLHQVNDQVVYAFVEHVKTTHTPLKATSTEMSTYTLANYAKDIKRFLNWCVLDDMYTQHVQANTVMRIKKPKVIETIIETFSDEQLEQLFNACDKEQSEHLQVRDKAILSVLLDTGIRAHELVTLTLGHVDLDPKDPHIRVLGKGPKWGEIGLGEQARRAVQKYIRMFREPTIEYELSSQRSNLPPRQEQQVKRQLMQQHLLFVNRSGKPLTVYGLHQMVARLGEWAGIEGVRCSPHTWRHTFSVRFWRKTHDIRTLSKLLRHSSIAVTERYLRSILQSEARRGAPSVLDDL